MQLLSRVAEPNGVASTLISQSNSNPLMTSRTYGEGFCVEGSSQFARASGHGSDSSGINDRSAAQHLYVDISSIEVLAVDLEHPFR